MITSNVLSRVFHLKYGVRTGTCFTIDVNGRQYLVTAKHIVVEMVDGDVIEIFQERTWKKVKVNLIGHHADADVTVFSIPILLHAHKMEASLHHIALGQDVYFLGFPLGIISEGGEINRNFPLPLIKKGCLSAIQQGHTTGAESYFYVDGHNNSGFSGGPVVFKVQGDPHFRVGGIVHGYVNEIGDLVAIPTEGETKIVALGNSGILKAFSIANATELIEANPVGTLITETEPS